jgi:protoheme IX farnesyltransferase
MTTATITNKVDSSFRRKVNKQRSALSILSELTKLRITFFVAITTFVGFIVYHGTIDSSFILPTIGVLILASGASALNEYQERESDARMPRTSNRPIPIGTISPFYALLISLVLILFGALILAIQSFNAFYLGLFTLLWYNGVYTLLKKKTALAIVPGSLVGALPPVIGWVAAGGGILDPKVLSLALFMFIWQIPHFWILMLIYDDQYKEAGYPTLSNIFSFKSIINITYSLIILLIISSGLIIVSELTTNLLSIILLVFSGLVTLLSTFKITYSKDHKIFKKAFLAINLYVLFVLLLVSIESIY